MAQKSICPPILFLPFNRPKMASKVFKEIRKARPPQLFIYSDGPRNNLEKKKVIESRLLASKVDWTCKVKTFFREKNSGVKTLVEAYRWFFDNVEAGIILEEDAVPNQDFFKFCHEMLKKYKKTKKIFYITGCNFQEPAKKENSSYRFSIYPHTYGFAMWGQKWKDCDYEMQNYLNLKKKGYFRKILPNFLERKYLLHLFDEAYFNNPHAIDTRLMYYMVVNKLLAIAPNKNLVRGIGFTKDSAHTGPDDLYLSKATDKLKFPLKGPKRIERDVDRDLKYLFWIIKMKFKKRLRRLLCAIRFSSFAEHKKQIEA